MIKVVDLRPGDKIKYKDTFVYVQKIKADCVLVSKQENSPYVFSISKCSHKYDDLMNRVSMTAPGGNRDN